MRNHHILSNPAVDLDMLRVEMRLPKHVLSADEADAPGAVFVPHDEVMTEMETIIRKAELRLTAKRS